MRDPRVLLQHLADCLGRIHDYTQAGREGFFSDQKTQDAVIRNLEIIGQVVRDLDPETLSRRRPEIPWSRIAGMRNILAHQYLGVDLNLVWNIVDREVSTLRIAVDHLLQSRDSQDRN